MASLASAARQWAEDDDRALKAARAAWDRVDTLLIGALLIITVATLVTATVMLLKETTASWRRRGVAVGVLVAGCTLFSVVVVKMGVVWLIADPSEAGGPPLGSGAFWWWCLWLFGALAVGLTSVVASFIVVGAEDL